MKLKEKTTELLKKTLEERKEEYLSFLKELVSIDTHTLGHGIAGGLEAEGQEYLEKLMRQFGADTIVRDEIDEEILKQAQATFQEGNLGHNNQNRWNLHGRFSGKGAGCSILFNGHMDTMPSGDLDQWKTHPHHPTVKDGRLYGLGAADMKSGLLAALLAVKLLKDAQLPHEGDVIISSVADEEGGGNGSIQAALQGYKADGVVVCEPTSRELIVAHMGFVFFRVSVEGKANHSGAKWKGVSAIDKAIDLIGALNKLEHRWLLEYKHPLLPAPNLNVGVIHGGTAGSTVAGSCTFEICVHYLPEIMDYHSVVREVTEVIRRQESADPWLEKHPPTIEIYQAGGAFEQEDNSFVQAFQKSFQSALGYNVQLVGSPAGCDSRTWKKIANCSTVQYGPGNLEQCHAVNEYVELDQFYDAILIYSHLILEWGSQSKNKENENE